jgi:hypothetical protein
MWTCGRRSNWRSWRGGRGVGREWPMRAVTQLKNFDEAARPQLIGRLSLSVNEFGRIAARQSGEIRLAFRMYVQHGIGT